jgi:hypothetical protein
LKRKKDSRCEKEVERDQRCEVGEENMQTIYTGGDVSETA